VLPAVAWDTDDSFTPSVIGRLRERTEHLKGQDAKLTAVALLFAQPTEPAIEMAAKQTDYFDARTGGLWDLFFAGYYRYGHTDYDQEGEALSKDDIGAWFSPREFNTFRDEIETRADGKWVYSGGIDLVLINAFLVSGEEPMIDWPSTVGRSLIDPNGRYRDISLGGVIEAVSRGIERGYESQTWNLPTAEEARHNPSGFSEAAREIFSGVVAGVITGLT
jgi:hypothetical protein